MYEETSTQAGHWNFSINVDYLHSWVHTEDNKKVKLISKLPSHLVSKYLLSVYVPDAVLVTRDIAVNTTHTNNCPHGI